MYSYPAPPSTYCTIVNQRMVSAGLGESNFCNFEKKEAIRICSLLRTYKTSTLEREFPREGALWKTYQDRFKVRLYTAREFYCPGREGKK